jgi:carboxypeptidase family protein
MNPICRTRSLAKVVLGSALVLPLALTPLAGQTSTASLRGHVFNTQQVPLSDAQIQLTNEASGIQRGTLTNAAGFYNVGALQPGTYRVRVTRIGLTPQAQSARLQIGETVTLDFHLAEATIQLETVVSTAASTATNVRTSEVGANVTTEQIENLPQGNRNFLDFAALAPGVQQRGAGISAGGASTSNTNLFIDGASYKSDVLPGGVAGQDPSLERNTGVGRIVGNPFPQSAVQEFRVLTQNYKAEYQKASGAVITAATKSGTNRTSGELFYYGMTDNFIARNAFQDRTGTDVPNYARNQFGGSLGGPIIKDKAHYFLSYEGNFQQTDETVAFTQPAGIVIPAALVEGEGLYHKPLHSNLFFGKGTYQISDNQDLMFTANVRNERDERDFGGNQAASRRNIIANDVNTYMLRHTLSAQPYTNEAQVSWQRFSWKQDPENFSVPTQKYFYPGGEITRGGNSSKQDFVQDRLSLRNDITRVAGAHVFKGGGNIDFLRYDVNKLLDENPTFFYDYNRVSGFNQPYEAGLQIGDPGLKTDNRQLGFYIQDDWTPTQRLTFNLGVRWDYETNWLNNDYVTPPQYVNAVRDFLAEHPYFNLNDYVTSGDDRPNFYGAFQPRLGFSYDITGDNGTVVFGGGGLFYDRINYNVLLDEKYKVQRPRYTFRFAQPGSPPATGEIAWNDSYLSRDALINLVNSGQAGFPEVFLIKNDQKPPYTIQGSLGLRRGLGQYQASVTGTMVNGYNYFKWIWGNRDPNTNALFFGTHGMGSILISNDDIRSWYKGLLFQLSKRFIGDARWGGDISYTLSKTESNEFQDVDDAFALDFVPGDPVLGFKRRPSRFDERHRIAMNLLTRIPFDIRMSTITTLGSGFPYTETTGCTNPNPPRTIGNPPKDNPCHPDVTPGVYVPPTFIPDFLASPGGLGYRTARPESKWFGPFGKWAYRNVDLRFQKDIPFGAQNIGVSLDVINVFNFVNYNFSYNFVYNVQNPQNPRHPTGPFDTYDSRRIQLGAKYSF